MRVIENEQVETITTRNEVQPKKITIKRYKVVNENVPSMDEEHVVQFEQPTKITPIRN